MKNLTSFTKCCAALTVVAAFATGAMAQSAPIINAPITKEQKDFVLKHAPILIQPDFEAGYDNVVAFNFANPSQIAFKMDAVEAKREKLEDSKSVPASQAIVDWDYIEIGGAISLNFMFFRPLNDDLGIDRRADAESAVLIAKKNKVGIASDVGFPEKITQVFSNAHGAGISAACDADADKCLVDISKSVSLGKYTRNQSIKRTLEVIDGRTAFVSEHYKHAMVPLTNSQQLLKDIDVKNAVIYFPEGADVAELRKIFSGATFVSYSLRSEELSSILIPNKVNIVNTKGPMMNSVGNVTTFMNTPARLVSALGTEFRNDDGSASGANGYWGWAPAPVQTKKDGSRHTPKDRKDGADGQDRPHSPALHIILGKALYQYFSPEEINEGALKPVRNGFMEDIK